MKKLLSIFFILSATSNLFSQCSDITKEVDKFTGETKFMSPSFVEDNLQEHPLVFYKKILGKDTLIMIRLETKGETISIEKGVIILLNNGKKISRPDAKINVSVGDKGFNYSSMIVLSNEDVKMLKESLIASFRLYIYDCEVPQIPYYKEMLNCIIIAK